MGSTFCRGCQATMKRQILHICIQNFFKIAWKVMDYNFQNREKTPFIVYHKRCHVKSDFICEMEVKIKRFMYEYGVTKDISFEDMTRICKSNDKIKIHDALFKWLI